MENHFYDYTSAEWFGEKNLFEKVRSKKKYSELLDEWRTEVNKFW